MTIKWGLRDARPEQLPVVAPEADTGTQPAPAQPGGVTVVGGGGEAEDAMDDAASDGSGSGAATESILSPRALSTGVGDGRNSAAAADEGGSRISPRTPGGKPEGGTTVSSEIPGGRRTDDVSGTTPEGGELGGGEMDDTGCIRGDPDGRPALGLPAEGKAVHVRIHRPDMGARRTETTREGERISIEGLHTTEVGSDVTVEEAVKLQQSANLIVDIFSSLIVGMESEEIWISTHS